MTTFIVTRHDGAAEWIKSKRGEATVIAHMGDDDIAAIKPGDTVIGVLPLSLAASIHAAGGRLEAVDLPGLRPDQRGKELSPAEMDAAGATLVGYRVERLELTPERRAVVCSNGCFIISDEGKAAFVAAGGTPPKEDSSWGWEAIRRDDPALVKVVESLGDLACISRWAKPKLVTVPAGERFRVRIEHAHDGVMIDVLELESDGRFY